MSVIKHVWLVWLSVSASVCAVVGCLPAKSERSPAVEAKGAPSPSQSSAPPALVPLAAPRSAAPSVATESARLDPDGDDDAPPDSSSGEPLKVGHFERVGRAPGALQRICDLTPFAGALYAAHATRPLGLDGASITRYRPTDQRPFTLAFDWNRAGEPTKGGGAGQGFLRVHAFRGRLFVTDADPPYNGFGFSEPGTEGFVFVSSSTGQFAPARMPGHLPPHAPSDEKAGAAVLPRAYHVLDAIQYRGLIYAATGSVPPGQRAWHGASPAALQVETELGARFEYAADYPRPYQEGVWRFTFLVRFRDRLYAGLQDYDGREPNDYVYFEPPRERSRIAQEDLHAVRITESGAAQTLRWYADVAQRKLYWLAWSRDGVGLRVTSDGDHWSLVPLPGAVGVPTDLVRYRGALHVLTTHALLRLSEGAPTVLARIAEKRSPFELDDSFCAAPLGIFDGALYAGGQRDGALYRFREDD